MKSRETIFVSSAILLILSSSAFAYRQIIDLGGLGTRYNIATSVNDKGQIVGYVYNDFDNPEHVCLFDSTGNGANIDLGIGVPSSISSNGQIVGMYNGRACLFSQNPNIPNMVFGTFGGARSDATSINSSGQIVGWSEKNSSLTHACLFDNTGNGNDKDLGALGGTQSYAYSINDAGRIVGEARNDNASGGWNRACIFSQTDPALNIDLGSLDNTDSWAFSINNANQIVGGAAISSISTSHACLFDPTGNGNNIDLGTLGGIYDESEAFCINDKGQIVGYSYTDTFRACLFDPSGHGNNIDLNTLIDPSSGWFLTYAYSINNNGWIVGSGIDPDGYTRAFLLTPEPATILLFALGGFALRRRK
ncbi:MAG: PEP-CTERM sorting domain-containing protein [Sedimentisphaerales bacterium]